MSSKEIGDIGEAFAAEHYSARGYIIAAKNYRSRLGEIDVVAENDEVIVFCEVKTRRSGSMLQPSQAVNIKKQEKLILTAMKFLEENECDKQPRFDVFEIWQKDNRIIGFNVIEGAFDSVDFSGRYDIF